MTAPVPPSPASPTPAPARRAWLSPRSLSVRLLAFGVVVVALSLATAALGLGLLFERHAARRLALDLDIHLTQLLGGLEVDAAGALVLPRPPADPRFAEPLSGLYWQASDAGGALRSRSLWDERLHLPPDWPADAERHDHRLDGPAGQKLLAAERALRLPTPAGENRVRVVVAADLAGIAAARAGFLADLVPALAILALVLLVGAFVQVRLGLRPLAALAASVARVRAGARARVETSGPVELSPLVDELNALIAAREEAARRARNRAADLAHGLKTPLAALAHDAHRLAGLGQPALAADIEATLEAMRRHVERELTRARLETRASARPSTPVGPIARRLAAILARTPTGERVSFEFDGDPALTLAMDADDLAELLGSLMENAATHAAAEVRVGWAAAPAGRVLRVEDDGPGLAPGDRARLLARGARLDQSGSGAGLGLAIVADIADAYGASLALAEAPLGGLAVTLALPAG